MLEGSPVSEALIGWECWYSVETRMSVHGRVTLQIFLIYWHFLSILIHSWVETGTERIFFVKGKQHSDPAAAEPGTFIRRPRANQEYQLWYSEALVNRKDGDNGLERIGMCCGVWSVHLRDGERESVKGFGPVNITNCYFKLSLTKIN